ncbi:MAG TPA: hypothetical protein VKY92_04955 [Verrucomicrobiae bacterium]|nr:hypothetical protein [Verrucomicrobiae bacterium]
MAATLAMAMSGCHTPQATSRTQASLADASQQPIPFLDREQYSDQLALAVDGSLRNHRFTRPWIVVKGSDRAVWFVAERFNPEQAFDRIYVRVAPGGNVTASITAYQFVGSDWAILGKLFAGDAYRVEAESIAGEIKQKLNELRR